MTVAADLSPYSLQVVAKPVQLLQHEVHVRLGLGLVGDDGAEEVGELPQWLIADHHAACLHHPALSYKYCLNVEKISIKICHNPVGKFF